MNNELHREKIQEFSYSAGTRVERVCRLIDYIDNLITAEQERCAQVCDTLRKDRALAVYTGDFDDGYRQALEVAAYDIRRLI